MFSTVYALHPVIKAFPLFKEKGAYIEYITIYDGINDNQIYVINDNISQIRLGIGISDNYTPSPKDLFLLLSFKT